jgi:RNA recognition motif-containing protein
MRKNMNIYVGNLSHDVSPEDIRQVFEAYGEVSSANIIKDK